MVASPKGGHELTREDQVKGGKQVKHGVDSLQAAPLSEWPEDKRLVATEIAEELRIPELVEEHERQRVARGLVILQTLEAYIAEQVKAGMPLDEMAILKRWPAFQNATMRGLKQVRSRMDGKPDPKGLIKYEDLEGDLP